VARDFTANTANFLSVGDVTAVDITGFPITLCAWIRPDVVNAEQGIATKWGATTQYELELTATGKASFGVNASGGSTLVNGATTLTPSVWQHVAGKQTTTDVFVYLNGVQDGTSTVERSIVNTNASFLIGKFGTGTPFDGRIAEVAVWNIALSDTEIAALAAGYPASMIQAASLKGYWQIQGTASPEPDTSGNGNSATINGTLAAADGPLVKTGGAKAGLVGAGPSESIFDEAGRGVVGAVGSGASEFIGAVAYTKLGFATVGAVGSGVGTRITAANTYTKAGFGKVGATVATSTSEFHGDVLFQGVSIAFGSTTLDPYPTWTRIDE